MVGTVTELVARRALPLVPVFSAPDLFHLAGTLVAGGIWPASRRIPLSFASLRRLDAGGTVLLTTCYALMGAAFALDPAYEALDVDPHHAVTIGLLACTYTVLARAIALPSTAGRTSWITTTAMVPIVLVNVHVLSAVGLQGTMAVVGAIDIGSWGVASVVLAAISSRIIFGLRAEADKVKRLGQYTLEERLGEGGMGVVYRASHAMLRRPCAIKLLPPDKAGEEAIRRFEREVQVTAGLSHPSTIAIYDYGRTPQGVFYYAMEFLEGLNLEELVQADGQQAPGRVIHVLQQVCGALAEAHHVGLIHETSSRRTSSSPSAVACPTWPRSSTSVSSSTSTPRVPPRRWPSRPPTC